VQTVWPNRTTANSAHTPGSEDGAILREYDPSKGRWPANLILDAEAGAMLDEQAGREVSRFFYCAKASRAERNAGLDGFEERMPDNAIDRAAQRNGDEPAPGRGSLSLPRANVHPTVKPIDLMRYLVRLVTPPGGTVLDPFTGSGTTGIAAGLEGFDFIGIEREAEYREIAEARLNWWGDQAGETDEILRRAGLAEKKEREAKESGHSSLFDEEAA
jgi:site-specific DNA-methyltransferase (adenine-specific)